MGDEDRTGFRKQPRFERGRDRERQRQEQFAAVLAPLQLRRADSALPRMRLGAGALLIAPLMIGQDGKDVGRLDTTQGRRGPSGHRTGAQLDLTVFVAEARPRPEQQHLDAPGRRPQ